MKTQDCRPKRSCLDFFFFFHNDLNHWWFCHSLVMLRRTHKERTLSRKIIFSIVVLLANQLQESNSGMIWTHWKRPSPEHFPEKNWIVSRTNFLYPLDLRGSR
jgi:hypothetical protein